MVDFKERTLEAKNFQVTPISAIVRRLKRYKNYKNFPFIEKLPSILDLMLDNEFKENIQKIYLFGSYAYGKPHEDSDIDFCVIIDDGKSWIEVANSITIKLWDEKIGPSDILVCNADLFYERANLRSIEKIIIKYGILIYERK